MTYGDLRYLPRRTAFDKVLFDKVFEIGNNPQWDEYHRELASIKILKEPIHTQGQE